MKTRMRAAVRAEAYKQACRRWYTDESAHYRRAKRYTLLEACCDKDSRMCNAKYDAKNARHVRLTKEDDVSSAAGLRKGVDAIRALDAGHVTSGSQ